ncbi:uncharacterized protein LOC124446568 [Xenia sp. Carnegie-2017]|uniref:uncharacterized protein LOC124446568 n=1 Tax=Xenia sp. Carnegie-2017 TaxID=2897299 RepID=UPI001F04F4E5|nr:uncharacterized protein LOC124446568 [Xenia sp. Carnegie-2017]
MTHLVNFVRTVYVCLILSCLNTEAKESQFIYKNSARTVGNALVVSWKLNQLAIKQLNASSLITSGVYFCPLNKFQEHQNCKEDKIQLCIVTIEGKKFTSESISDNEFADYKRNSSLDYLNNFFEKDRHARISGSWNETSDEYECILHGIDECFVSTRTEWDNKEQIMIAVHTGSYAKELLFEVENTVAPPSLNQPKNLTFTQTGRTEGILRWTTCPYDNPNGFWILFHQDSGNVLECREKMLNYDDMYTRNWEKKCNLTTLRAYTNYTIEVYSFNGLSHSKNSLSGNLQITTNEQAPSSPPTIECAVCQEESLENGNRSVTVKWKLPPKEKLNGVVRKAKIKYWMKKEKRVILKYSHNVTEGKITKIQENADYFVQVAICTAGQLCSNYTEAASIPKNSNEVIHGRENLKILWIILLPVFIICFTLIWRLRKRRLSEANPLEDLTQPDLCNEINKALEVSEYNELPPEDRNVQDMELRTDISPPSAASTQC